VLLNRLSSRLGEKSVLRPRLCPDPQPEYAGSLEAVLAETNAIRPSATSPKDNPVPDYQLISGPAVRPLCLKSQPAPIEVVSVVPDGPPVRFRWQSAEHVVACSWGPERIDTLWWRGPHVERDYYRVETTTGQRFWLFRQNDTGNNGTGKWFLHGTFE
jgi:protein ImuB